LATRFKSVIEAHADFCDARIYHPRDRYCYPCGAQCRHAFARRGAAPNDTTASADLGLRVCNGGAQCARLVAPYGWSVVGGAMHRRAFLKTAAGAVAAGALPAPAISQRAAARTLRFVPQADLANFDPIWNTQYVVRNGAALIWDMLYGVDENLVPRRQMVEAEDVTADGLAWTFRLRPGLMF